MALSNQDYCEEQTTEESLEKTCFETMPRTESTDDAETTSSPIIIILLAIKHRKTATQEHRARDNSTCAPSCPKTQTTADKDTTMAYA